MQIRPRETVRLPNPKYFELTEIQAQKWWTEYRPTEVYPGIRRISRWFLNNGVKFNLGIVHVEVDATKDAVLDLIKKGDFNG